MSVHTDLEVTQIFGDFQAALSIGILMDAKVVHVHEV